MDCKSDEYYDTAVRECRHCSLVCDPQYSSSENNAECLSNCPGYMKTDAPPVVAAIGPLGYVFITLAVVAVIAAIIVFTLWYRKRLQCTRTPVKPPVLLTAEDNIEERLVVAIPESEPPDPYISPGIPLHGANNRSLSTPVR